MTEAEPWNADRFLQQVAHKGRHDLGAPIRAVRNFSEMLREELGGDVSDDTATYLEFIAGAGDRLDLMVRRIVELIRLDSVPTSLALIDLVELLPSDPEIEFELVGETSVNADKDLLRIVLKELTINTKRYGSGPVRITQVEKGRLLFGDNGGGIPAKHLTTALLPFHRLVPNAHSPGVGLGLPLAARCMERMGGRLALQDPARDHGLSVCLSLPSSAISLDAEMAKS